MLRPETRLDLSCYRPAKDHAVGNCNHNFLPFLCHAYTIQSFEPPNIATSNRLTHPRSTPNLRHNIDLPRGLCARGDAHDYRHR